ncbi:MAG: Crp/Fnr family transcriptional regulator [Acidobacteria bacterium]|nr:Crp/Fnr family transcriptional regulator [Acidobacteriota bacterium]
MKTEDFLAECESDKELSRILRRFAHSLMTQIGQAAACNRYHPIETRFARWLLMTRDRMRSNEFQITQEFLSNMLGVRREAVNKVAHDFQEHGLISYVRGHLTINNGKELENRACLCYQIVRDDLAA